MNDINDLCFFVSDLHGSIDRYRKLFDCIAEERPAMVFFGGDLLPHKLRKVGIFDDFSRDFLFQNYHHLKEKLNEKFPDIFIILGNDDPRSEEIKFISESQSGIFHYIHQKVAQTENHSIMGYSYVPPTPFRLKDWEKHDVDFTTRPGCIPVCEGFRTTDPSAEMETTTIKDDLEILSNTTAPCPLVCLFHSPPYNTHLDRAGLDGMSVHGQPLDVHVGSVAIRNFIKEHQPIISLHGHIHESTTRTGHWKQKIGNTICINGSHGGPELCLVKFNLKNPEGAVRELK